MTSNKKHTKSQLKVVAVEPFEDENRIDWERRSRKGKKDDDGSDGLVGDTGTFEEDTSILRSVISHEVKRSKKKKRQKHLIMDEESGRVVLQRRRKENRHHAEWDEWHNENE